MIFFIQYTVNDVVLIKAGSESQFKSKSKKSEELINIIYVETNILIFLLIMP